MKKIIILTLFLTLGFYTFSFAQTLPSQIERSQEILEKEKALREKLKEEKIFIKKIIVEGVTLLGEDELKEIISLFQKRWLTKEEIQQILGLIEQAYKQKGFKEESIKILYQIKKKQLIIKIEESIPAAK